MQYFMTTQAADMQPGIQTHGGRLSPTWTICGEDVPCH